MALDFVEKGGYLSFALKAGFQQFVERHFAKLEDLALANQREVA